MKTIKERAAGIVLTILSLLLTIGVKMIFPACGPKEDGSFMSCHWAEQAVFAAGIAMTVISVVILISGRRRAGFGACIALIPVAVVTALIPGAAINLCMMNNMRCHTAMQPAVIIICALTAIMAAVNVVVSARKNGESR